MLAHLFLFSTDVFCGPWSTERERSEKDYPTVDVPIVAQNLTFLVHKQLTRKDCIQRAWQARWRESERDEGI